MLTAFIIGVRDRVRNSGISSATAAKKLMNYEEFRSSNAKAFTSLLRGNLRGLRLVCVKYVRIISAISGTCEILIVARSNELSLKQPSTVPFMFHLYLISFIGTKFQSIIKRTLAG